MNCYEQSRIEEMLQSFKENPEREKHMQKLADAFFDWMERNENCEYGGWGLNDKRPFGNSHVEPDIAEIIGWDPASIWEDNGNGDLDATKESYLNDLYADLGYYLKYKWRVLNEQHSAQHQV